MSKKKVPGGMKDIEAIGRAGTAVKEGIIGSLRRIDAIETEILRLARNTVSDALRAGGKAAGESLLITKDVVRGAISVTEEVGTGLIVTTKSVAKGVVMGVSDVGGDVLAVASQTVRGAVEEAVVVGADVALVARRTVDGVAEAIKEVTSAALPKTRPETGSPERRGPLTGGEAARAVMRKRMQKKAKRTVQTDKGDNTEIM